MTKPSAFHAMKLDRMLRPLSIRIKTTSYRTESAKLLRYQARCPNGHGSAGIDEIIINFHHTIQPSFPGNQAFGSIKPLDIDAQRCDMDVSPPDKTKSTWILTRPDPT